MSTTRIDVGAGLQATATSGTSWQMTRRQLAAATGVALLFRIELASAAPGTEVSVKPIRRSSAVVRSALSTSATFEVTTSAPSIASIAVSPAPSDPLPKPSGPATQHRITVTGLNPQTPYDFAITTRPAGGKRSVTTRGAGGDPVDPVDPGDPGEPVDLPRSNLSGGMVSAPPGNGSMTVSVVEPPIVSTIGSRAGIRWKTNILTNGRIEVWPYGEEGEERALLTEQWFETSTTEGSYVIETANTDHRICMDGRKGGKKYGFNIGCAAGSNEVNWGERWFRQAKRPPSGMLPYRPGTRASLPERVAGLLALPGGRLLTFSESGALATLDTTRGYRQVAAWNAGFPVTAAAVDSAGRIYLALTDRRTQTWGCRCSHALVEVLAPDAQSPTGYAQTARLGEPGGVEMPGEPTAISLDSSGNLHVAVMQSSGMATDTLVYLFLADSTAPDGFAYSGPFSITDVLAMAAGPNGTMYFQSGTRSVIAAVGGLLAPPDSPVTEWTGSSLGGGSWILAAGICGSSSGSFFVLDGCLGGAQEIRTNDLGAFRMFAVWQTRGAGRPKVEQPVAITSADDGSVYVLDARARNGRPAVVQFLPNPATPTAAGRWVPQPAVSGIRARTAPRSRGA